MFRLGTWLCVLVEVISLALSLSAQQTPAPAAGVIVPPVVNFSGQLRGEDGKPLNGTVGATFSLYKEAEGGAPLWVETQNLQVDKNGHYTVALGSTSSQGLPVNIFSSGEARWLGVQLQGEAELPRVLLMSVPYAMKALDAETIGGKSVSDFVLAQPGSGPASASHAGSTRNSSNNSINPNVSGSGTKNFVPLWLSSSKLGDSNIFQSTSGKIGVGTKSPGAALDVNGGGDIRSTLKLFPDGSKPALIVSGTDFSVDKTGTVKFVSGQTFPGTGTITGVKAGSGLSGGGNSGKVTLNLLQSCSNGQVLQWNGTTWVCSDAGTGTITGVNTNSGSGLTGGGNTGTLSLSLVKSCSNNQVLQWNGSSWVCSSAGSGTITGVTAGTDLTGGGNTGNVTLNLDTNKVPQLAAANTFTATQTVSTNSSSPSIIVNNASNGDAISAVSTSGTAIIATSERDTNFFPGLVGASDGINTQTIGVSGYTSSNIGMGVYGQNVLGSSVLFNNPYAGVWGDSSDGEGLLGTSDNYLALQAINNTDLFPTVLLENETNDSLFGQLLVAFDSVVGGACTIDSEGDLSCSGEITGGVALVDNNTRKVSLNAVGATEDWYEDAGSGQLSQGTASIRLDPTFAQTVNTGVEYHVFLTPKGDCEGLYVNHESPRGFEVHELRHGTSNIAFDYRIMAKRRGHENVRLADVTQRMRIPSTAIHQPGARPVHVPTPRQILGMAPGHPAAAAVPVAKVRAVERK